MSQCLGLGSTGPAVIDATRLLAARGFLAIETDRLTMPVRQAVKAFQARHVDPRGRPLAVDGTIGPLTWWALRHPDNSALLATRRPAVGALPAGGTGPGRLALTAALREMQHGACEVGSNNCGPWVEKYLDHRVAPPANWCAGFVSWCYRQTPAGMPFRYSLAARDIREQMRSRGWLYDPQQRLPEPGDIVVWWRGQRFGWQGHVGLVHHTADGILHTVEGNKGGFPAPVAVFDYVLANMQQLLGFARVP